MTRARTSRHRRYSERCGGWLTVEVTPGEHPDCTNGKSAMFLRILRGRDLLWEPDAPLCLSPLYDPDSGEGRSEAASAGVDFFEAHLGSANADPPTIEVGTVIQGTHRAEDLIPALLTELERIDLGAASEIRLESAAILDLVEGDAPASEKRAAWHSEAAAALLEELFDALDERAPEGTYFGAHWGDGADFGWWPHEDE